MEHLIIRCWCPTCPETFATLNLMQTHHLNAHEVPLPPPKEPWTVTVLAARFDPPNWKAQAAPTVTVNGARP